MANPYFQFKSFTVYHDRCALKVSTDSCIFGAWLASLVSNHPLGIHKALDIGAGSGLLMLMLAQKFEGNIDGIEIDRDSYEQATENINASPWYNRLQLFNADIKLFQIPQQYDMIFANPPFFEGDLKSVSEQKNLAKHDDGLTLPDLLEVTNRNLTGKGLFAVLLPYHRTGYFEQLAANYDLFVSRKLLVRQTAAHPWFRSALFFTRNNKGISPAEYLTIYASGHSYSGEFQQLLKEYYLYL
jgi:tRNA1Val (adenine37-N6)-methyltransferase